MAVWTGSCVVNVQRGMHLPGVAGNAVQGAAATDVNTDEPSASRQMRHIHVFFIQCTAHNTWLTTRSPCINDCVH